MDAIGFLTLMHLFTAHVSGKSIAMAAHPDPTSQPPVMAPLAFAGLGLMGIIVCAARFQPAAGRPECS